jgi:hypothetical protein
LKTDVKKQQQNLTKDLVSKLIFFTKKML